LCFGFAFIFDYINSFHKSANSIATIVSTKVLTPVQAVIWAAWILTIPVSGLMAALIFFIMKIFI